MIDNGGWLSKLVGRSVMLLAIAFLAKQVVDFWPALSEWKPTANELGRLLILGVLYGASLYLLADNWHRIVGSFGDEPRSRTYPSYTITQIARYLPGNVAHLFGRAAYLSGGTLTKKQLGLATFLELSIMPLAAIMSVIFLVLVSPSVVKIAQYRINFFVAALIGLICPLALFLVFLAIRKTKLRKVYLRSSGAFFVAIIFMLSLGFIFSGVLNLVSDANIYYAAMVAILAWLIGYLTPGAPGGLGPREALLVLALSSGNSSDDVLLAALLFRVVTVIGDLSCFASGWTLDRLRILH